MATTQRHGQLGRVDASGNVDVFYPKTFSKDVYVNSNKRTLEDFLGNTSLSGIGDGTVTGAISNVSGRIGTNTSNLAGKAPTNHASTGTGYGIGNASNFGHVKISDNYTGSDGAAANGVAASSQALANQWYYKGTYAANGGGHGTGHKLYCRYNYRGDGRFNFGIDSGYETRTNYATNSGSSSVASNTNSITSSMTFWTGTKTSSANANVNLTSEVSSSRVIIACYCWNSMLTIPYKGKSGWYVHILGEDMSSSGLITHKPNSSVGLFLWHIAVP